jgi:hypothetical protein
MTTFSDRFVSLNKIVIAAAVLYTGAITFAHAAAVDPRQAAKLACYADGQARFNAGKLTRGALDDWMDKCDAVAAEVDANTGAHAAPQQTMPACSAKFVEQWNNWNGEKGAFAMPKTTCFLDEGNQVSLQVCGPKGCGGMPYVLENKALDEQIRVVLHILPACSAKFISFARMARDAKAADFPAKTCVMPGRLPTEGPGRLPTEGFYVCSKSDEGCSAIRDWIDANSHGNTEVVGP